VADRYPKGLGWALNHRLTVLGLSLTTIVASVLLVPKS
jgi:multidrug efflux pump subunit AcrB